MHISIGIPAPCPPQCHYLGGWEWGRTCELTADRALRWQLKSEGWLLSGGRRAFQGAGGVTRSAGQPGSWGTSECWEGRMWAVGPWEPLDPYIALCLLHLSSFYQCFSLCFEERFYLLFLFIYFIEKKTKNKTLNQVLLSPPPPPARGYWLPPLSLTHSLPCWIGNDSVKSRARPQSPPPMLMWRRLQ